MGAGITALASQLEFISGEALNGIYNVLCQDLPLIFSPCYSSEVLIIRTIEHNGQVDLYPNPDKHCAPIP